MDSETKQRIICTLIDLIDFYLADEEDPDLAGRARQDPRDYG
jgi:hypothetical protein